MSAALRREKKSTREDPAWPDIARLCGYLPLALRAAASYLANSEDISPARYASDLKDERSRLEKIGEQGVEMSVDASFGLSFQKLEPKLQQTFLDLSVFPGDFDSQAEEQICQDEGHRGLASWCAGAWWITGPKIRIMGGTGCTTWRASSPQPGRAMNQRPSSARGIVHTTKSCCRQPMSSICKAARASRRLWFSLTERMRILPQDMPGQQIMPGLASGCTALHEIS